MINFNLHATSEYVTLQAPQRNFTLRLPNVVTINSTTKKIVAIGDTTDEIQHALGNQWEMKKHEFQFIPAFSATSPLPEVDGIIMEYYRYLILREFRKGAGLIWQSIDRFDYFLHIPEYERFTSSRQRDFEYQVQTRLNARRVSINGRSVELPEASRHFEHFTRFICLDLLPLGFLLSALGVLGGAPSALAAMLILVASPVIAIVMVWIGKFIWLFLTRQVLPKSYLRFVLSQRRSSLSTFGDAIFIKRFLLDESV